MAEKFKFFFLVWRKKKKKIRADRPPITLLWSQFLPLLLIISRKYTLPCWLLIKIHSALKFVKNVQMFFPWNHFQEFFFVKMISRKKSVFLFLIDKNADFSLWGNHLKLHFFQIFRALCRSTLPIVWTSIILFTFMLNPVKYFKLSSSSSSAIHYFIIQCHLQNSFQWLVDYDSDTHKNCTHKLIWIHYRIFYYSVCTH